MKRIFALITAVIITSALFFGCGTTPGPDSVMIDGQNVKLAYVLKVNDITVSVADYRDAYLFNKLNFDGGDDTQWQTEAFAGAQEYLANYTEQVFLQQIAVDLLLKENNITFSPEDEQEVATNMTEFYAQQGGKEMFLESYIKAGISEAYFENAFKFNSKIGKLSDALFADSGKYAVDSATVEKLADENYFYHQQILISPNEEGSTANSEKAANILKQLREGADFEKLMKENTSEDISQSGGYMFLTQSQLYPQYTEEGRLLKNGDISEIVETDYGYHIIKNIGFTKEILQQYEEQITSAYKNEKLSQEVFGRVDTLTAEKCAEYDKLTISAFLRKPFVTVPAPSEHPDHEGHIDGDDAPADTTTIAP